MASQPGAETTQRGGQALNIRTADRPTKMSSFFFSLHFDLQNHLNNNNLNNKNNNYNITHRWLYSA